MPARWLRRSRNPGDPPREREIPAELTAMFLDMDQRQAIAQNAVQADAALRPASRVAAEWQPVEQQCYAAAGAYLALSAPAPDSAPPVQAVSEQLLAAARAIDAFYERHRRTLDGAVGARAAAAAAAETALKAAASASQRLDAADPTWRRYPSVQTADDAMQAALAEVRSARRGADLAATGRATERLAETTAALNTALDHAPLRVDEARRMVSSVRTRLDAVRTRADATPAALSELLREFHIDSSADLVNHERDGRAGLAHGESLLNQALHVSREGRPEAAIDLAGAARAAIGAAEDLIDAPGDRLRLLRAVRENPHAEEQAVRFRIRDAQRLAVSRGLTAQWGSVLDAQVVRIDRIVAALQTRNPDYWHYHLELEDVSEFVAGIVTRLRQEPAR